MLTGKRLQEYLNKSSDGEIRFFKSYSDALIGSNLEMNKAIYSISKMIAVFSNSIPDSEFDDEDCLAAFFNDELPYLKKLFRKNPPIICWDFSEDLSNIQNGQRDY